MTAIHEALDAASNAGVPVVWPDGSFRFRRNGLVSNTSEACGEADGNEYPDPEAADLTVAAIKRGLANADATLMTEGCSKGWHAHVMLENGIEVEGTGPTELAALTSALKGMAQ